MHECLFHWIVLQVRIACIGMNMCMYFNLSECSMLSFLKIRSKQSFVQVMCDLLVRGFGSCMTDAADIVALTVAISHLVTLGLCYERHEPPDSLAPACMNNLYCIPFVNINRVPHTQARHLARLDSFDSDCFLTAA